LLLPVMPYIVLAFTTGGVIDLYVRRQRHFRDKVNTIFSICKVFGLLFTIFVVFNIGPAPILRQNVGPSSNQNSIRNYYKYTHGSAISPFHTGLWSG
jgi:nucleoside recognition membrane protein YjiH